VDFDRGITSAINRLRDALGDSADNPVFVETVGRRGYRWIAPISSPGPVLVQSPMPSDRGAVTISEPRLQGSAEFRRAPLLGNLTPSRITVLLAPVVLIAVLALVVSFEHRQTRYTKALAAPHVPTAEVQDLYLKGRYYWSKRNPEDLTKAVDYFTQAIVRDPGYAPAFVGLADCYNLLREFSAMPGEEAFPRALAAAQKAVELDPSSAEAHNSLAFATFYWNWDAQAAEREFKRALELNPNYVQAHHWYATFLLAIKRFPEALDQIEQARKLDPSSTTILADKGFILWKAGRKQEAVALLQQLESTDPSLATTHGYLAGMYFEQKDYAHSFAESKRAAELRNDQGGLAVAEAAERGFASGGMRGMYEQMLPVQEKLFADGQIPAYDLAVTCAALGKNEDTLRYLQTAFDKRNLAIMFLNEEANFNVLHNEPAYKEIEARIRERLPKSSAQ